MEGPTLKPQAQPATTSPNSYYNRKATMLKAFSGIISKTLTKAFLSGAHMIPEQGWLLSKIFLSCFMAHRHALVSNAR